MSDSQFSTFVELLQYRAQHQPEKTAYIFLENGETEQARLTYADLHQQASALAERLRAQLSAQNTSEENTSEKTPSNAHPARALLLYPSGLEFIVAFFGCLYARIIAVPVYPPRRNQSLARLEAIAQDSQPTLALTTQSVLDDFTQNWPKRPLPPTLTWLATDHPTPHSPTPYSPLPHSPTPPLPISPSPQEPT
ncbi:MAG: AMP-binding protein, partial [Cyanobacteria bacterium P01_D01_bin.36]